ncbi:MAG: GtrA family protein [Bacillota bacterium]|nr:GtrA family protein [Bacillota bacterium]
MTIRKINSDSRAAKITRYSAAGVLTTLVNYILFWILINVFKLNVNLSNFISVLSAVIFAYVINKTFVFRSKAGGTAGIIKEAAAFFAARGITMLFELLGVFIMFSLLKLDAMLSKISVGFITVALNYILSEHLVFRNAKKGRK